MREKETVEPKADTQRVLRDDELDLVAGGFWGNDGGCIPTMTFGPGGVVHFPQGPNPWLTWGSPERGGH
jgi:hypothetical protein